MITVDTVPLLEPTRISKSNFSKVRDKLTNPNKKSKTYKEKSNSLAPDIGSTAWMKDAVKLTNKFMHKKQTPGPEKSSGF